RLIFLYSQSLNAGLQIDGLALNVLDMLLTDHVLLRDDRSLVGTPPIRGKPCDTTRRQQTLEFQKDGIVPPSTDRGQPLPTVMIHRMPAPSWMRFPRHIRPQVVEF